MNKLMCRFVATTKKKKKTDPWASRVIITQARMTYVRRLIDFPVLDICKRSGALIHKYISFVMVSILIQSFH